MGPNLDALKLLAYRGASLNVTVTPDPDNEGAYILKRGNDSVSTRQDEKATKESLAHYPGPVTVNGEPLETTPFPDLTRLTLTKFNPPYTGTKNIPFDYDPGNPRSTMKPQHSAYAGGVLCHVHIRGEHPKVYYSPDNEEPHEAWQKAIKVEANPVYRIETDEIHKLREYRQGSTIFVPQESELHQTVAKRAVEQFQKSMFHPQAPPRYQGDIHHYFLAERHATPYDVNIPIIVHAAPVLIDLKNDDVASPTSLAAALYKARGDLVPVKWQTGNTKPLPRITRYQLNVQEDDQPKGPNWQLENVKEIFLQIETDQLGNRTVQADYDIAGPSFFDTHVRFVRHRTDREELAQAIVRGYWDDEHFPDWDCLKDGLREREEQVYNMIEAAFGDPDQAFRNEMTKLADSFYPSLPRPDHPISVQSRDKSILITYTPQLKN